MNTQELADKVAEGNDISKADARKIVDSVFENLMVAVAAGDDVSINGFGKFSLKQTAEREGRNPATGAAMTIPAGKKASFSAAKGFKERLSA